MLVLLPGIDGTDVLFGPLRHALPHALEVQAHAFPRGRGNSYRELLATLAPALPADRPFVLLAWSFSGPLAVMLAAQSIPTLRGLILCSTFARRPHPYLPKRAGVVARPALMKLYPTLSRVKARLGGYAGGGVEGLLQQSLAQATPEGVSERLREVFRVDVRPMIPRIHLPTLYVRATRDRVVPAWCIGDFRRGMPHLRVAEIDGPHPALVTNPSSAAAVIGAFVDEVLSGSADQ